MKKKYIVYKDRILIEKMLKDGVSVYGISIILKNHEYSVFREIERHHMTPQTYNAYQAQLLV